MSQKRAMFNAQTRSWLKSLSPERPVLIAGPTASGKSALALEVVARQGGIIINADALQVFANWRSLTARPGVEDEARAPHRLYGHVAREVTYSVGHWLRDVAPLLAGPHRAVIVGGTGLYFTALTQGLATIPPTPPRIRAQGDALMSAEGSAAMLAELDPDTLARIDQLNPMRVQRAWEVWRSTGRGLASWQNDTPAPLLALDTAQPVVLNADRDWLAARIAQRFDLMLASGAIDEARANLSDWDPALPSSKAIGAPELIAHLKGEMTRKAAREAGIIATRQYAKRQRTWFRSKMRDWDIVSLP
jgi:tRNA dimethylallyltransferase